MEGNKEMLDKIADLLVAAGYARAQISSLSPFDKLTGGLAWCITACNVDVDIDFFYDDNATLDYKLKVGEAIEGALQKMECPHPLQVHQIQSLDYAVVYPVVQWLIEHSFTNQEMLSDQVFSLLTDESHKPPRGAEKLLNLEASPSLASDSLLSKDDKLCRLRKDYAVRLTHVPDTQSCHQREDLARKNREFLLYRRKLDEVPSKSELMQYERCFVEHYLHFQEKLQETRRHFATYNALAEANELTLKEISLLNSIHAQFEQVMTSPGGRTNLLVSMSDIARGVSQKVEKMEARLLAEQNALSSLKKRHSQLVVERRRYDNLMKLFQEECAKNEALRSSLRQAT